jgi:RNA polymerase sigma factor (sigma-70 family)
MSHPTIVSHGGQVRSASDLPLFAQSQAGCRDSLKQLMAQHEGLVQAVVRKQWLGPLEYAEALQAGRIGLWRAILGYDPMRGTAFSTYAWPAIQRAVWRAVKQAQDCPVFPTVVLPLPVLPDPAKQLLPAEVQAALDELLTRLPRRFYRVLVSYYGLQDQPPSSLRQLGRAWGLSHESVRQQLLAALVWLRHPPHSLTLRQLLERNNSSDYEQADALAQSWLRRRGGRHGR